MNVTIPNDPTAWPAGFYAVEVQLQRAGESFLRSTNQLTLAVAARITLAHTATATASNSYTVTTMVTSVPDV